MQDVLGVEVVHRAGHLEGKVQCLHIRDISTVEVVQHGGRDELLRGRGVGEEREGGREGRRKRGREGGREAR